MFFSLILDESNGLKIPDDPSHIFAIGVCHHQMKEYGQAFEALRWGD